MKSTNEINEFTETIFNTVREPLLVLDNDLRVIIANRSFYNFFKVSPDQTIGTCIYDLGNNEWDFPKLKELLEKILPQKKSYDNYEVKHDFTGIGNRVLLLNARQIERAPGRERIILLTFEDITDITEQKDILNKIKFNSELLSHVGQAVIATNLNGNVIYWNKAAEEIYGWSSDEAMGQNIVELTPIDLKKEHAKEIMKDLSEGKSWSGEFLVKRKDGSIFPAYLTDAPILDSDGKLTDIIGISSDITERKRTEIERKVMYDITRSATTTDNIDELLKLIHRSLSKVIYAENCFVALHDENTGLFNFPFFKDKHDPNPEMAPLDKSCTSYVFRTGKSLLLSQKLFDRLVEQHEVELIGTNSPSWIGVPLKGHFNTIGVLVLQHYEKENVYTEGDIMFLEAVGREIAYVIERKLTEEQIQKGNEQFKMVWNGSIDGMRIMDENGTIILVNEAFCNMIGLTRNQLEGSHFSVLFNKTINETSDLNEKNSKVDIYKLRFWENKIEPKFERELNLWDGRKVWFEVTNSYMEIAEGKSVLLSIFRDITERKQAESIIQQQNNRLHELNASKDKFFSIIAHDLKSPFNGLINLTALMADTTEKISLDEFAQYSKMLNKAARNIYILLNNLLEWAQVQRGTIQFTPTEFDLSKLVSRGIDTISQRAMQKQIEIISEIHNSLKVYADEKMIDTIIRNLLSNAVKFTRTGGKVRVKSKRFDDSTIQVSIEDNGVGISEDVIKKLFRIDQKVGTLGTEGEPSTGLGLLLCKEFVEMHEQKIWAESKKERGSTFCFTVQEENCYETK